VICVHRNTPIYVIVLSDIIVKCLKINCWSFHLVGAATETSALPNLATFYGFLLSHKLVCVRRALSHDSLVTVKKMWQKVAKKEL